MQHNCGKIPDNTSVSIRYRQGYLWYSYYEREAGGWKALSRRVDYCPFCGEKLGGPFPQPRPLGYHDVDDFYREPERRCETCEHSKLTPEGWDRDRGYTWLCRRYPEIYSKRPDDGCYEWKPKEERCERN